MASTCRYGTRDLNYSVPVMAGWPDIKSARLTKNCSLEEELLDDETQACLMCSRIWQMDEAVEVDDSVFE